MDRPEHGTFLESVRTLRERRATILHTQIRTKWLTCTIFLHLLILEMTMALNIRNSAVERLVEDVARLAGESKTEAVRRALEERKARLAYRVADGDRLDRLRRFLETEVWPTIPPKELGRRLSREEEEHIPGYRPEGV
jgi:antitoxin VapB